MTTVNDLLLIDNDRRIFATPTQQTWTALFLLNRLLEDHRDVSRVIEIGCYAGGLTTLLGLCMRDRGRVLTIDIDDKRDDKTSELHQFLNIQFKEVDIFTAEAEILMREFSENHRTLFIFDGGNKKQELNTYHDLAKPGDFVLVHDWLQEVAIDDISDTVLTKFMLYNYLEWTKLNTRFLPLTRTEKPQDPIEQRKVFYRG